MKKTLSIIISLTILLSLSIFFIPTASAASYPWLYMSYADETADYYAGDNVTLKFTYFREFNNEKVYVKVYDSDDILMATAEKQFGSSYSSIVDYSVTWDTTGYETGTYTIVTSTMFYSFYEWHTSPKTYEYKITLKDPSLKSKLGWNAEGNSWRYLKDDGNYCANEWLCIGVKWYYFNEDGYMVTGWLKLGNTWYYLNDSGAMQTGWLKLGNTWYYLNTSGAMATGWAKVNGTYYYFNQSGAMQTGWIKLGSTWYYLKDSGAMATGWAKVSGTYYYFNQSGAMQTGWIKLGSTWYYLKDSGAMATGSLKIGNKWYRFNSSGAWIG